MTIHRFRFLGLRAWLAFFLIDLGFRWWGFEKVHSWITSNGKAESGRDQEDISEEAVERTWQAVQWATRFYYRRRLDCLPKAMTTYYLFKRQGIPAALYLGVRKFPFSGHAWVECGGRVLDDLPGRVKSYTPLKRLA